MVPMKSQSRRLSDSVCNLWETAKQGASSGQAQRWVMLPGVHPWLTEPTLCEGNLSTVPAVSDLRDTLEKGSQSPPALAHWRMTWGVTPNLQPRSPGSHPVSGLCLEHSADAVPVLSPHAVQDGTWGPPTAPARTAGPWKDTVTLRLPDGYLTRHRFTSASKASLPSDSLTLHPQICV